MSPTLLVRVYDSHWNLTGEHAIVTNTTESTCNIAGFFEAVKSGEKLRGFIRDRNDWRRKTNRRR